MSQLLKPSQSIPQQRSPRIARAQWVGEGVTAKKDHAVSCRLLMHNLAGGSASWRAGLGLAGGHGRWALKVQRRSLRPSIMQGPCAEVLPKVLMQAMTFSIRKLHPFLQATLLHGPDHCHSPPHWSALGV